MEAYVNGWEARCYEDGIPDELPAKLLFSGRAPSWKALAVCILNNDSALSKLGLSARRQFKGSDIELAVNSFDDDQMRLF